MKTPDRGVRWRADVGWEMRCDSCAISKGARYWPITREFWDTNRGLSRCRACWSAYERNRRRTVAANRRRSEAQRIYQRDWMRTRRRLQRLAEGRERYERRAA